MPFLAAVFVLAAPLRPSPLAERSLPELVRARLDLARPVALAKLYSRAAIDDPVREAVVLESVAQEARRQGLEPSRAVPFFQRQIEASKIAQRAWQTEWARYGAPLDRRPNLATEVRPRLDRLTVQLVAALKHSETYAGTEWARFRPAEPFLFPAWRTASAPFTPAQTGRSARRN